MKIALAQICSLADPTFNLEIINHFAEEASAGGAKLFFLPETFYSLAAKDSQLVYEGESSYESIRAIAIKHQLYLIGGSALTSVDGKIINRAYNFSPTGEDLGHYDKINLFACESVRESDYLTAGKSLFTLDIDGWKIGETICFDLRFSELYKEYRKRGCHLMTVASAFTAATGRDHWRTLVCARAIESQSYIVAANQWGFHNESTETYGHSLVVDPWGKVIVDAKDGVGLHFATLDLDKVAKVRQKIQM